MEATHSSISDQSSIIGEDSALQASVQHNEEGRTHSVTEEPNSRPSSFEILSGVSASEDARKHDSGNTTIVSQRVNSAVLEKLDNESTRQHDRSRTFSESSENCSNKSSQVDWAELERTEKLERTCDDEEDVALLLARLEQENNALATDPKSGLQSRNRSQSRPPSMNQLRMLVEASDDRLARISKLPSPPPMTELEFWVVLVQNYAHTAQRLPTLTSHKIRGGIPAPLRGVVWISMSGARDVALEDRYDALCGETSPYETMIGKDIGRSFPGVEMFREPEGEGQKMLGRVLNCFSLYDPEIGYCQGLGLLVGPLLMQMGEREAFCVLVRLMDDYDLRSCFLPNLFGLHLRINQFQHLLKQHVPEIAEHLESLQIEGAYLSQWFLSLFATTCPLPLLFRIYDVIFAEGASETLMRVALAIMRRNQKRILAFTEFEDVMQLLLSRALWDPYGLGANCGDELVNDFTSFTKVVTGECLQNLEKTFLQAQKEGSACKMESAPGVQSAASRFLGRLWQPSITATTKPANLSLNVNVSSRSIDLRRTASKQSLASTLNSIEGSSDSSAVSISTAATEVLLSSRASDEGVNYHKPSTESIMSSNRVSPTNRDKDLHSQIEDLLNALNDTQRQQALLSAQLEREREERLEDHRAIRDLTRELRKGTPPNVRSVFDSRRRANSMKEIASFALEKSSVELPDTMRLLLEAVEVRLKPLPSHSRQCSSTETKQNLRDSLAHSKEQLAAESLRVQALSRQVAEQQVELTGVREDLKEIRHRLKESHSDNQRLENIIADLRKKSTRPSMPRTDSSGSVDKAFPSGSQPADTPKSAGFVFGGLREFKLGRTDSAIGHVSGPSATTPTFSKRSSSLATQTILSTENHTPADQDALLLELVTSKTSEATARQELEELKAKFEAMRRMLGLSAQSASALGEAKADTKQCPKECGALSTSNGPPMPSVQKSSTAPSTAVMGGFWGWKRRSPSQANAETAAVG